MLWRLFEGRLHVRSPLAACLPTRGCRSSAPSPSLPLKKPTVATPSRKMTWGNFTQWYTGLTPQKHKGKMEGGNEAAPLPRDLTRRRATRRARCSTSLSRRGSRPAGCCWRKSATRCLLREGLGQVGEVVAVVIGCDVCRDGGDEGERVWRKRRVKAGVEQTKSGVKCLEQDRGGEHGGATRAQKLFSTRPNDAQHAAPCS